MALPWVRLDSSIASHDKILALLNDPSSVRWQAAASYMFALGWSGAHETDGFVPRTALPFVHGSAKTARLLEKYRLWEEKNGGWDIKNYETRQVTSAIAEGKRAAQKAGGAKGNCIRHHGPDCGCWRNAS